MPVDTPPTEPILDAPTREFVRRCLQAGLVELADVKKVVVSLMAEDNRFTPERLADGLVGADAITHWQSRKLLAGKVRGFHLGNYRLLRPLGRGGMGVVFLAQHAVMNRLMALKILPSEASKDPRRIERFKEEARASAKLEHKNIVQAYDFTESGKKLFIVMEYVEGIDLHRAVARDGVMSSPEALDAMIQTTDALAHAHQRGIIHRDIKPSNLLLRNDGVVKVSDMGLARIGYAAGDTDAPNRLTGTADFIAPEQAINSQAADARSDIYSLGCTWYFLLTGTTPYPAGNLAQRLAKHQTAPIPKVTDVRSDCPKAISELIQRMMAKRPEDRPASAAELLVQLERIGGSKFAGGELANRPQLASGTIVADESSSFGSLDEIGPPTGTGHTPTEVPEIDFGSLPPMPVTQFAAAPQPASNDSKTSKKKKQASNDPQASGQSVLLGVGLAFSIIALLVVFGITIYHMTNQSKPAPRLKATEDGKGNVIVVGQ